MTDKPRTDEDLNSRTAEDKEMEALFGKAELRAQPSPELLARAKAAARPDWEASVARQRAKTGQRSRLRAWAIAASIATLTLLSANLLLQGSEFSVQVVRADGLSQNSTRLQPGTVQLEKADLLTSAGLAELQLNLGDQRRVDLRLAPGTSARWLNDDRLLLLAGSVYVDTHGNATFGVDTSAGAIRDIGTRYVVSVDGTRMEVAVSDGAIELQTAEGATQAAPASGTTAAVITVNNGTLSQSEESRDAPRWAWVNDFPKEYRGKLIAETLEDVASRLGKTLIYESSGDRAQANSYVFQGHTADLPAAEALEVIAAASGLLVRADDQSITVSFNNR